VIYDGEDFWFTFGPTSHLKTVFDDMLAQTFNPDSLPCTIPATGIKLEPPTQTHFVNGSATVTATVVDSNANPQSGLTVTFTVTSGPDAGATGTGVTDASGKASFTYSDTTGPGTDILTASFTDGSGTHTSNSVDAIWVRQSTSLAYVGDVTQDYNDSANLDAVLTAGGSPVVGQLVTFTLGTQSCTATTDATGLAACSIVVNQPAGTYPLSATFAGSGAYEPSSVTGTFVVTLEETTIVYTGPTVIPNGGSTTLSAVLKEDGTTPIAGRTVTLTLGTGSGAQSCTGVTNASGQASCPISPISQPLGPGTVTAAFAGDAFYKPATDSAPTTVFEFAPGGGAFVVGDLSATGSVTFWGAQWWKLNSLSGGPAPASFKGFAASPSIPSCGTAWSTRPGNSTPPPDRPLPSYIGVIVTSSAAKAGSTESGNTVHIIVVKTDAGYASNPGHAGTGTVVATLC